jgi:hypothetical protein
MKKIGFAVLGALLIGACAHRPVLKSDAESLQTLKKICTATAPAAGVDGEVWMKVQSAELKGQFPAMFRARRNGRTDLEITNLIGGVEARVRVEKGALWVQEKGKGDYQLRAREAWAGFPVKWFEALLLGDLPCPDFEMGDLSVQALGEEQGVRAEQGEFVMEYRTGSTMRADMVESLRDPVRKYELTLGQKFWVLKSETSTLKLIWKNRKVVDTSSSVSDN